MATYTITSSDLINGLIAGFTLDKILKLNPGVPLKVGAVVQLPSTSDRGLGGVPTNQTVPTSMNPPSTPASPNAPPSKIQTPAPTPNPAGAAGASGVSNTGQGIPNVPASMNPIPTKGVGDLRTVMPQTMNITPLGNVANASVLGGRYGQRVSPGGVIQAPFAPGRNFGGVPFANQPQPTYPGTGRGFGGLPTYNQVPNQVYPGAGNALPQDFAGPGRRVSPGGIQEPSAGTPGMPTGFPDRVYPQNAYTPSGALKDAVWNQYYNNGSVKRIADTWLTLWEKWMAFNNMGMVMPLSEYGVLSQADLAFFLKYMASTVEMAQYQLMFTGQGTWKDENAVNPNGVNEGRGGGGGGEESYDYGGGGGGGGGSSSDSGTSFYGLINWRL